MNTGARGPIAIYRIRIFFSRRKRKNDGEIYQQRPETNNNATIKMKLLKVQRGRQTKNGRTVDRVSERAVARARAIVLLLSILISLYQAS